MNKLDAYISFNDKKFQKWLGEIFDKIFNNEYIDKNKIIDELKNYDMSYDTKRFYDEIKEAINDTIIIEINL